jgi:polyferredoxin
MSKSVMMRTIRRIAQLIFLLFFLLLFSSARDMHQSVIPADSFLHLSPLLSFSTLLTTHHFSWFLLPGLLLLLLTIPLGRFFCGWICPMGTILDASDKLFHNRRLKSRFKIFARLYSIKYVLLIILLAASLFSLQWAGIFDPLALLTRTMTVVIFPIGAFFFFLLFKTLFSLGIGDDLLYSLYYSAQKSFMPLDQPIFLHGLFIGLIFLSILTLGYFARRFWCRFLCPLGALFGLFARKRLFQRVIDDRCTACGMCAQTCRMNAIAANSWESNSAECIECAECLTTCPEDAVGFRLGKSEKSGSVDLSRRRLIWAMGSGILGVGLLKTSRTHAAPAGFLRPPGAKDEASFLEACLRCQECVKICESTGCCLQPSLLETGIEGLWTPIVAARMGYCEYNCRLCGQVCPSGAIQELALADKQQIKIGRAVFNKATCIPWSQSTDCLVCEEHCPLPHKAIRFNARPVQLDDGSIKTVKLPYVEETLCIGCGICEFKCPVATNPGIVIFPPSSS